MTSKMKTCFIYVCWGGLFLQINFNKYEKE